MEKKITLIKVDGRTEVLIPEKKPDLEQMQEWVGGYIEPLKVHYNGHTCTMVVNEKPAKNEKASQIAGRLIIGDVFILEGWRL